MNSSVISHARLYFIMARDAPLAVIFRRGPSKWVQIIRWNTDNDTFEEGQWFHGRIYEKRCDLSPDGRLLLYFAQKLQREETLMATGYTYAWTAVSKIPYLTALALWPKGDCWNGGGLFESDNAIWLNHPATAAAAHLDHQPRGLTVTVKQYARGEDDTVQSLRLDRDGWRLVKSWKGELVNSGMGKAFRERISDVRPSDAEWLRDLHSTARRGAGFITFGAEVREKALPDNSLALIMKWALVAFDDTVTFAIRNNATGERFGLDGPTCADWDQAGRLVYVENGKVYAANMENGAIRSRELADFNDREPKTVASPKWAKTW